MINSNKVSVEVVVLVVLISSRLTRAILGNGTSTSGKGVGITQSFSATSSFNLFLSFSLSILSTRTTIFCFSFLFAFGSKDVINEADKLSCPSCSITFSSLFLLAVFVTSLVIFLALTVPSSLHKVSFLENELLGPRISIQSLA